VIDEDQVGNPHPGEVPAERVHPETIGVLGVARGDVSGRALVEAELAEDAERGGEAPLALQPLVGGRQGGYPATTWVASEASAPLGAQIRASVRAATTGVAVP